MKRFGCLALLALLLLAGWTGYHVAFPARVGGAAFSQLPPQEKQQRRAQAQNLVTQIEEVARQARKNEPNAPPKTFVVEASEEQLNTLLQDRLRTEKFPISDLRVGLSQDLLTLQGTAKYGGIDWPATISGTLKAKNGALDYQIESLGVSGYPAPGQLRKKAQSAIETGLQKAFEKRDHARIESVEIAPGKLTVRGQTG